MPTPARLTLFTVLFCACATVASAQPVVFEGGVVNGASFVPAQLPQYGIAQGSIFSVFGENMGPEEIEFLGLPAPTELAGTSIQVTVGTTTLDCFMVFSQAGIVAAILPSDTPVGDGTLTVTFNGQMSNAVAIKVVESTVGIFTLQTNGRGPAVVTDPFDFQANTIVNSFAPGDVAVLWVTGLGPRSQDAQPQVEDLKDSLDLTVLVGDQPAEVLYAGPSFNAGVDQINFEVPPVEEGCAVSIVVEVGGSISNFSSMSVSSEGLICDDDPRAFSRADNETLQATGRVRASLAFYDTAFLNLVPVAGSAAQDLPGEHDGRQETASVFVFETLFNTANPNAPNAVRSCTATDRLLSQDPLPVPNQPLASMEQFSIAATVVDPDQMEIALPPDLFVIDSNGPADSPELSFQPGQQWTMNITVIDSAQGETHPFSVSHMIQTDPEPFADFNPDTVVDDLSRILSGEPVVSDLVISGLPTTPDHLVSGTATIRNSMWETTILCVWPGGEPFRMAQRLWRSIDCGEELGPCNGGLLLNIFPNTPLENTPDEFLDKLSSASRIFLSFSAPAPSQ